MLAFKRRTHHRADGDDPAAQPLADIIIGITKHFKRHALAQERAKRLPCRPAQANMDVTVTERGHAEQRCNFGRKPRADRAVGVAHGVGELHLLSPFKHRLGIMQYLRIKAVRHFVTRGWQVETALVSGRINLGKDRVEIKIIKMFSPPADLAEQLSPANHFVKRTDAKPRENLTHLLGNEGHQVDHLFRRTREFLAQRFILDADADRAGV